MSDTPTAVDTVVRTGLYIGGEARDTADRLAVADPGKRSRIVGTAAAATPQDAADAVAAARVSRRVRRGCRKANAASSNR